MSISDKASHQNCGKTWVIPPTKFPKLRLINADRQGGRGMGVNCSMRLQPHSNKSEDP